MKRDYQKEDSRVVLRGAIIVVVITAFLLIVPFSFLYLTFGYEEIAIKNVINNPYVNNRYHGWKTVGTEEYGTFRCPPDWKFVSKESVCMILDDEGNAWAIGAKFGTKKDAFLDHKHFLEVTLQKPIKAIQYCISPDFVFMDGSTVGMVEIEMESRIKLYYLRLSLDRTEELFLIVFKNLEEDCDAFDIAEAIAYSYAYH